MWRHGHTQIYLHMRKNAESQPMRRGTWAQIASTMERFLSLDPDVQSHTCPHRAGRQFLSCCTTGHTITDRNCTILQKSQDAVWTTPSHLGHASRTWPSGLHRLLRLWKACGKSTELRVKGSSSCTSTITHLLGDLEQDTISF